MRRRIVAIIGSSKFNVDKRPINDEEKAAIDRLTLDKIEMADEVVVVNPHGYVGQSTREQVEHAREFGKPVKYEHEQVG